MKHIIFAFVLAAFSTMACAEEAKTDCPWTSESTERVNTKVKTEEVKSDVPAIKSNSVSAQ